MGWKYLLDLFHGFADMVVPVFSEDRNHITISLHIIYLFVGHSLEGIVRFDKYRISDQKKDFLFLSLLQLLLEQASCACCKAQFQQWHEYHWC